MDGQAGLYVQGLERQMTLSEALNFVQNIVEC